MNGLLQRKRQEAQTLIFFLMAFGLICLLCGLAIDSGVLYLAKARLSRAVDGAALQAVGNASQTPASVATIMRNFAIANYTDLVSISAAPTVTTSTYTIPGTASTGTQYSYVFADGTAGQDSTGNFRRYVQIIFQLGSGGQITSALCNARCPVHTYFMGYADGVVGGFSGVTAFKDLKVSSSATATRNPRLIMVVIDRSASMLSYDPGSGAQGGAFGLPAAVVTFLNFFDTSSDYIGIVSFSSYARLEMPLTTNFLNAGTNDLYDSYQFNTNTQTATPGVDPEEYGNVANYTNGTGTPIPPRRMKFGGQTAADEGLRLALEQLMSNSGFNNPNVVKYIVLFTDGAWNTTRTLLAAPGYTNVFSYPAPSNGSVYSAASLTALANSAGINPPPYSFSGVNWGYLPMPNLSPWPDYSNSVTYVPPAGGNAASFDSINHRYDVWQSADTNNEPINSPHQIVGAPVTVSNNSSNSSGNTTGFLLNYFGQNYYTCSVNVWLPPGSVDYVYASGNSTPVSTIVSSYANPTLTTNITLLSGQSNVLVVPGYVVDGVFSDALDLEFPDNVWDGGANYQRFRNDGYHQPFMWPDDNTSTSSAAAINSYTTTDSIERNLMFRNYANLLTGYYITRPDDPPGPAASTNSFTGAVQPLNGNGPYYPGAAAYWPFDLVGFNPGANFGLVDATSDPDLTQQGLARHVVYTMNMLSPAAAPSYAGELFYQGTGGTTVLSGTSAASTQITSAASWQSGAPTWLTGAFSTLMKDDSTNTAVNGANWRPASFNGSVNSSGAVASMANTNDNNLTSKCNLADGNNKTGGYVSDASGNIHRNAMCYSGRPTHYYDFSKSQWLPIPDNHATSFNGQSTMPLELGKWKAQEYAWHARQSGVTIFTVGYGSDVNAAECNLLADVANAVNIVQPAGGTNPDGTATTTTNANNYIQGQPEGQQFYATTPADISNDFYQVGTAINGALTH